MIKKKAILSALVLVFCLVTCKVPEPDNQNTGNPGGNENTDKDIEVTFQTLTQNGSATAQTTALTLKFDKDIANLAATDITLTVGTTGAKSGTLTKGSTTGTYTLGISGVTASGSVSVSVAKKGYTVKGNPQTTTVYPTPTTPPPDFETVTTWNGLTIPGGTTAVKYNIEQKGKTNVLKISPKNDKYGWTVLEYNMDAYKNKEVVITMTFDIWLENPGSVAWQLAQSNSTYPLIAGGWNQLATGQWHTITATTTITPTGSTLYLATGQLGDTNVAYLANFTITVAEPVAVTFQNVSANGNASTQTTALTLTFNKDIAGLTAADITLDAGGIGVVKGNLAKGSTTGIYTLGISSITATASVTVTVSVSKTGYVITGNSKTVTVYPGPPPDPNTKLFNKWPFPVGVAVSQSALNTTTNAQQYALLKHFNVVVAENEMKPQSIMPNSKPATFPGTYRWTDADKFVTYGKANNTKVRGHVLVWHSQTPDWFFDVTTTGGVKSTTMQKAELYDRMEKHIKTVFEHFKGDVLWWDVCNEVVGDDSKPRKAGDPANGGSWYTQVMENSGYTGDTNINRYEFVLKAFQFARKYADLNGGTNVKLYLTDYNTEHQPGWGKLAEFLRLVDYLIQNDAPIDGVGFQTHIDFNFDPSNISRAIDLVYAKTRKDGKHLMSQVTELDMGLYTDDNEAELSGTLLDTRLAQQAALYRQLFDIFKQKYTEGKLDMVLLWGTDDGHSWRSTTKNRVNHPLLFDRSYQPKAAFLELVK